MTGGSILTFTCSHTWRVTDRGINSHFHLQSHLESHGQGGQSSLSSAVTPGESRTGRLILTFTCSHTWRVKNREINPHFQMQSHLESQEQGDQSSLSPAVTPGESRTGGSILTFTCSHTWRVLDRGNQSSLSSAVTPVTVAFLPTPHAIGPGLERVGPLSIYCDWVI